MDYAKAAIISTVVGAATGMVTSSINDSLQAMIAVDEALYNLKHKSGTKSGTPLQLVEEGLAAAIGLAVSSGGLYVGDMILDRVLAADPTQGLYFSFGFMATQSALFNQTNQFLADLRNSIMNK